MNQALLYLVSSFWLGAVHAATPGHGKTISAAYLVGTRGRPVDALILGIFVTLSHTSGIVLVAVLASLGLPGLIPQRIEAYLALFTGILVIVMGLWMLLAQYNLLFPRNTSSNPSQGRIHSQSAGRPDQVHNHDHNHEHDISPVHAHLHGHSHDHEHLSDGGPGQVHVHPPTQGYDHAHNHGPLQDHHRQESGKDYPPEQGEESSYHSHGWGIHHTHRLDVITQDRPSLMVLLGLSIAGGLLPDPAALAILLSALASGKVILGLGTVLVFSLGFATTLVVVGVLAAKVGEAVFNWLTGPWIARVQRGTALLIVVVGIILTVKAWSTVSGLL
jgi:nickel/cobalt exporter